METMEKITGLPADAAREIKVLRNGKPVYDALRKRLDRGEDARSMWSRSSGARTQVGKEFLDLLMAAARRGVRVRLLLDELGCLGLTQRYFRPLIEAGGEFSWCHTLYPRHNRYFFNLRNHRKLQVIDGRQALSAG